MLLIGSTVVLFCSVIMSFMSVLSFLGDILWCLSWFPIGWLTSYVFLNALSEFFVAIHVNFGGVFFIFGVLFVGIIGGLVQTLWSDHHCRM